MFRHHIKAEKVLALLCFISGVFLLVFMAVVLHVFDPEFREQSQYLTWEDWSAFGLLALIGVGTIACSFGLYQRQRWAVSIITVILALIILVVVVSVIAELGYWLREPVDAFCLLLAGCGWPICFILLFNSK